MLHITMCLTISGIGSNTVNLIYLTLLLLICGDIHTNPGPVFDDTLSICHLNVNSLYVRSDPNPSYKLDEIYSIYCIEKKCTIICLSETWLNPSIPDTNIELPGYDLYRRDRNDGYGGVAIYVSKTLSSSELTNMRSSVVENIWLCTNVNNMKMLVAVFYRPPNADSTHAQRFIEDFQNQLQLAYSICPKGVFISGDFNDRRYDWSSDHANSDLKNMFFDLLKVNNLHQVIQSPTHFSGRSRATVLDLFITDMPNLITGISVDSPIGLCHHCPLYITLNIKHDHKKSYSRKIWLFDKANFDHLNDYILDLPWYDILDENDDVNVNVENFYKIFIDVCSYFIPNKTVQIRPHDKPWMTGHIRRLLRKRNRYHKQYRRTQSVRYLELWRNSRKVVKSEIKKQKAQYFVNINEKLSDSKTPNKLFWKLTKSLLGFSKANEIPCLKDDAGNCFTTPLEKAEHLAHYFASQNRISPNSIPILPPLYFVTEARLSRIEIKPEVVYKILASLDGNKACGPDGIGNKFLKVCALSLAQPLSAIFQKSLDDGVFPTVWKDANLSALFKAKEKYIRSNYRPISLLSCMSKCLERCVFVELYKYCMLNNLLTWKNSGFKLLDSTVLQLISLVHKMYENLDKGRNISIIFLDVSKAFDRVWHHGLIFKLKAFGIWGPLLQWFESYLSNRRQRVIIDGQCSTWYNTFAGVPQGSILGPLLFLIYMNDIVNYVTCDIRLFADDTCIFDINDNADVSFSKLNSDLVSLQGWAKQWCISFNPSKTVYMHMNRKTNMLPHAPLYFNGTVLTYVDSHKHLGVFLDDKLNWERHITYIIDKVSNRLNAMRRVQFVLPRTCLETIYKCMVLPVVDYADVLYPVLSKSQNSRLESVQRQAALICTKAYQRTPNILLLNELGWENLCVRRRYHALIIMYKIQNGITPEYLSSICPPRRSNVVPYALRNDSNLLTFFCKYVTYRRSFFPVAVTLWNELGDTVKSCFTLHAFKLKLKEHMLTKRCKLFSLFDGREAINHTRLRLGLSGLNGQRFMFNFITYSLCHQCQFENESVEHYLLYCQCYAAQRQSLFITLDDIYTDLAKPHRTLQSRRNILSCVKILLNGDNSLTLTKNVDIFKAVQNYIKDTKRLL